MNRSLGSVLADRRFLLLTRLICACLLAAAPITGHASIQRLSEALRLAAVPLAVSAGQGWEPDVLRRRCRRP